MPQPSFTMLRAAMDGFSPEGDTPSKKNINAFLDLVVRGVEDAQEGELDSWDQVLDLTYAKLAFFRVYYCGECPSTMPVFPPADS